MNNVKIYKLVGDLHDSSMPSYVATLTEMFSIFRLNNIGIRDNLGGYEWIKVWADELTFKFSFRRNSYVLLPQWSFLSAS